MNARHPTTPTLAAYWDMLNNHDWEYEFSDDHGVYKRENQKRFEIQRATTYSEQHRALCNAFKRWATSSYGSMKERVQAKPLRPEEPAPINQSGLRHD